MRAETTFQLAQMSAYVGAVYTRENVTTFTANSTWYMDKKNEILTKIQAEQWVTAALAVIHGNISSVRKATTQSSDVIATKVVVIKGFPNDLAPVINAIRELQNMDCRKVGTAYTEFKDTWCGTINVATLISALAMFVLGLLSVFWVFMTVSIEKKMSYPEGKAVKRGYDKHGTEMAHRGARGRDRRGERSQRREGRERRAAEPRTRQRAESDYDG